MKLIRKLFNVIETSISSAIMVAMTALCFANVVSRHLLHASLGFTEEVTTALFVFVCVMGTALCARDREHLGLTVLTDFLPQKWQIFFSVVANLLAAVFCVLLMVSGVSMVWKQYKLGMLSLGLGIPEWIYEMWLPVGAFFMTVRFVECAWKDIKMLRQTHEEVDE